MAFDQLVRLTHERLQMLTGVGPSTGIVSHDDWRWRCTGLQHEAPKPSVLPMQSVEKIIPPIVDHFHPVSKVVDLHDFIRAQRPNFIAPLKRTKWKPLLKLAPVAVDPCLDYKRRQMAKNALTAAKVGTKRLNIGRSPVFGR